MEYFEKIRINKKNNQRHIVLSIKKLKFLNAEKANFLRIRKEDLIIKNKNV
ncbi:hypothetical protein LCGC14_0870550 [marine sediment metagenome]|uniref:Uncharacterized protein n=1 Tax=marine sediment metagenome TaxID=412755 RepID=A0A0F9P4W8_9ZZZZ